MQDPWSSSGNRVLYSEINRAKTTRMTSRSELRPKAVVAALPRCCSCGILRIGLVTPTTAATPPRAGTPLHLAGVEQQQHAVVVAPCAVSGTLPQGSARSAVLGLPSRRPVPLVAAASTRALRVPIAGCPTPHGLHRRVTAVTVVAQLLEHSPLLRTPDGDLAREALLEIGLALWVRLAPHPLLE